MLPSGVQRLPGGGICLRDRVHWHQGTHVDLHARPRSLCHWRHGGGFDWLLGPGLVDLPNRTLPLHVTLPPLLLEVPRDAILSDGQGPLQGDPDPAGHRRPLQRPGMQAEGGGSSGAAEKRER